MLAVRVHLLNPHPFTIPRFGPRSILATRGIDTPRTRFAAHALKRHIPPPFRRFDDHHVADHLIGTNTQTGTINIELVGRRCAYVERQQALGRWRRRELHIEFLPLFGTIVIVALLCHAVRGHHYPEQNKEQQPQCVRIHGNLPSSAPDATAITASASRLPRDPLRSKSKKRT